MFIQRDETVQRQVIDRILDVFSDIWQKEEKYYLELRAGISYFILKAILAKYRISI